VQPGRVSRREVSSSEAVSTCIDCTAFGDRFRAEIGSYALRKEFSIPLMNRAKWNDVFFRFRTISGVTCPAVSRGGIVIFFHRLVNSRSLLSGALTLSNRYASIIFRIRFALIVLFFDDLDIITWSAA
jgi:hypothetical protein